MVWSHSDISLEDLLNLIKSFIDMLILASGYQSSGLLAHWNSQNLKKAFQWAIFFENVFDSLSYSDNYQESIQELDKALTEIKSNPHFPKGLNHLTSKTLSKAKSFLLEHLIQTLPLREEHLKALANATIEMDFNDLEKKHIDCLEIYLQKLTTNASITPVLPKRKLFTNESVNAESSVCKKDDIFVNATFSMLAVQELNKRHSIVSCVSSTEKGLNILSKSFIEINCNDSKNISYGEKGKEPIGLINHENSIEPMIWSKWKARSLSYLLDKRTIRLVSGANMLFSTPNSQWVNVFESLDVLSRGHDDTKIREVVELVLLGCISSRWNNIIAALMSSSYKSLTISKLYEEVQNILQHLSSKEEMMDIKEKELMEYVEVFLRDKLHYLWKLSPVLAAISVTSSSQLLRSYLKELENQLRGEPLTFRCCNCAVDKKEHTECEVGERIWCLYAFHICGSSLKHN